MQCKDEDASVQEMHSTGGNLFGVGLFQGYFPVAPPCCPSIAVRVAAGRGEGGGGKAGSGSVEAAVPALVAGCDALSAADTAGTGGPGCSRPALPPPRAASALYLHRATARAPTAPCQPESGGVATHKSDNESSSQRARHKPTHAAIS